MGSLEKRFVVLVSFHQEFCKWTEYPCPGVIGLIDAVAKSRNLSLTAQNLILPCLYIPDITDLIKGTDNLFIRTTMEGTVEGCNP